MNPKRRIVIVGIALLCVFGLIAVRGHCMSGKTVASWCWMFRPIKQITRPEWEQLLPEAQFYLVEYDRYGSESSSPQKRHFLIVEQSGQRYAAKTYDLLLEANGIEVTADNRELVAKAWALMTIPNYLSEEVAFTTWEPEKDPRYLSVQAYNLTGWAKLGGVELAWYFVFAHKEYRLVTLGPDVLQIGIGDYIEVPPDEIPYPQQNAFYFFPVE